MRYFWIDLVYATVGIMSNNGVVIHAPPIVGWMIRNTLQEIKPFLLPKKAKVIEIYPESKSPDLSTRA